MSLAPGKFDRKPLMRWAGRWDVELVEGFTFLDPVHGPISVPPGFRSDLASIRILRTVCLCAVAACILSHLVAWAWLASVCAFTALAALVLYALVVGYGNQAAILHDWLYGLGLYPRPQCDAIYRRALHTADGTALWRALIFWLGVRLGGARYYTRAPTRSGSVLSGP